MKVIDDKGRLFGLIRIIDFLAVVIVIAIIAVAWARFGMKVVGKAPGEEKEIEVTFLVSAVRDASVNAVKLGDKVRDSKTNNYLGVVVDKKVEPADIVAVLPDGRLYETTSTQRKDMYITLRGSGIVSENLVTLGGVELRVGTQVALKGTVFALQSTVVDVVLNPKAR
ncbi:MAG TPA: DUF4330 domain-containing protein [Firmicutes bacterium]|nr:DUF4330 domain-containing protein [Bacillota bacterium]